MASVRDLIIRISADSGSYRAEMQRATRMGGDYYKSVEAGSRRMSHANKRNLAELRAMSEQMQKTRNMALSFATAFTGSFAAASLVNVVDEWGQKAARIKIALESVEGSTARYADIQARMLEVSNRNGKSIDESQELYIASAKAMQELGYSTDGTLDYIESLSSAFTANATRAERAQSAMNALSKAQVTGKLSGMEWKTVTAAMPTVIGDVAKQLSVMQGGIKVTEQEVKKLAAEGKISMELFVDAMIKAKDANNDLADSMDNTVGDGFNRVTNALKAYVGEANQSLGVTRALSAGLSTIAENMGGIVTVGSIAGLVALSSGFGRLSHSVYDNSLTLIANKKNQIATLAAQRDSLQQTIAQTRADRIAAVQAQNALVGHMRLGQSMATKLALQKQLSANSAKVAELAKAETAAVNELTAANVRLKTATSAFGLAKRGLLSLIGGYPGLLMAAGGALYYYYQKQEAARQSAIEYADSLDALRDKLSSLSKEQLGAEQGKLLQSIEAQTEAVEKQFKKVSELELKYKSLEKEADYIRAGAHPAYGPAGPAAEDAALAFKKEKDALNALNIANGELYDMEQKLKKSKDAQHEVTLELTHLRQSEIFSMESLNKLFSDHNKLLHQTVGLQGMLAKGPLLTFTEAQQKELQKLDDAYTLLKLKGEEWAEEQARQEAHNKGFTGGEASQYMASYMRNYRQGEANKAADEAARAASQAAQKSANATQQYQQAVDALNRELAVEKIRFTEGEDAAKRYARVLEVGAQYTGVQRDALIQLGDELEKSKQKFLDYREAISADPYRGASQNRADALERLERQQASGAIESAEEVARRKEQIHSDYLSAIAEADQRYAVSSINILAGSVDPLQHLQNQLAQRQALIENAYTSDAISNERKNQLIIASDRNFQKQQLQAAMELYAGQSDLNAMTIDIYQAAEERIGNALTGLVTGTQSASEAVTGMFASMAQAVIHELVKMGTQAMLTRTIFASLGIAGGATASIPVVANAKGNVYDSPSLSHYSNQIVNKPTMFAFARGAGIMGEAGPEAIMPLTRGRDGSLGVRATGGGGNVQQDIKVTVNISSDGKTEVDAQGAGNMGQLLGDEISRVCMRVLNREIKQGGIIDNRLKSRS